MFAFTRESVVTGLTGLAASRPSALYETASQNVAALLLDDIETPPSHRVRSFRDRLRSTPGRILTRFLIKLMIVSPLPSELQAAAWLVPVSMLWSLVPDNINAKRGGNSTSEEHGGAAVNGSIGGTSLRSVYPFRAPILPSIGGRLAMGENGILYGSALLGFGMTGTPLDKLAGVRTAALGDLAIIKKIGTVPVIAQDGKSVTGQAVPIKFGAIPAGMTISAARIEITKNNVLLETLPGDISGSDATAIWPAGREMKQSDRFYAQPFMSGPNGDVYSTRRPITFTKVDADVDSKNQADLGDPARTDGEDDAEDVAGDVQRPGRVIFTNDGDRDNDGIPDFADGTELFKKQKNDVVGAFTPMLVELPATADLSTTKVKFAYSSSDPRNIQKQGTQDTGYTYTPAPGALRVWTRNGDKARKSASTLNGGDFVASEVSLPVSALGTPVKGDRTYRFFVEALNHSHDVADQPIKIEVSFKDMDGSDTVTSDQVRMTVLNLRLVEPDANNNITPLKNVKFSQPSPTVIVANSEILNLRASADGTKILGDIQVSGQIGCAICDHTPGALGMVDSVKVFVNGGQEPVATLPVSVQKAAEQHSLLKPYAYNGTFSAVVPGVELSDGSNHVRLEAADHIYNAPGYSNLDVQVQATAPAPVLVDYRMALDMSGIATLEDLTETRDIPLSVTDTVSGRTFSGPLRKTSDAPLTLQGDGASIVFPNVAQLTAALGSATQGSVNIAVSVPSIIPSTLAYALDETNASSSVFKRKIRHLGLSLASPALDAAAPDTITAELSDGDTTTTTALTETGDDTQVFTDGSTTVTMPLSQPTGGLVGGAPQVVLSSPVLGVTALSLTLVETSAGSFETSEKTLIDADAWPDWTNFAFSAQPMTVTVASDGGEFHPLLMQVRGPELMLAKMDYMETADGPREIRRAFDGNYYVFMKHSPPNVTVLTPGTVSLMVPTEGTPLGEEFAQLGPEAKFYIGFWKGFGKGLFSMAEGLYELGKLSLIEGVRTNPLVVPIIMMDSGDRYKAEMDVARNTKDLAFTLAKVNAAIQQNQSDYVAAVLLGRQADVARLGAPYRVGMQLSVEVIEALSTEYLNDPPEVQGEIFGRATFEIAALASVFAKAGALGNITKLAWIEDLRGLAFFKQARNVKALKTLEEFEQVLARACGACFVAGTPVHTSTGLKGIEQVAAGEQVLSRDPATGHQDWKTVDGRIVTHPTRLLHVRYRGRSGPPSGTTDGATAEDADQTSELLVTADHPFFVVGRNAFVPTRELKAGETLALADGGVADLLSVTAEDVQPSETATAYNLTVDDYHTYFVGRDGVWVHNAPNATVCQMILSLIYRLKAGGQGWEQIIDTLVHIDRSGLPDAAARYKATVQEVGYALEQFFKERYPGKNVWSSTNKFTSAENAADHALRHLTKPHSQDVPASVDSVLKYIEGARDVVDAPPPGTKSFVQFGDGHLIETVWLTPKGEFVVQITQPGSALEGAVRTYYVPTEELPAHYFAHQFAAAVRENLALSAVITH